jgi:hypothetical protein
MTSPFSLIMLILSYSVLRTEERDAKGLSTWVKLSRTGFFVKKMLEREDGHTMREGNSQRISTTVDIEKILRSRRPNANW